MSMRDAQPWRVKLDVDIWWRHVMEKVSLVSAMGDSTRLSGPHPSSRSAVNRVFEDHSASRPVPLRHTGESIEIAFDDGSEDSLTRRRSSSASIPGVTISPRFSKPVSIIFAPPNNLGQFNQAESSSTDRFRIILPCVGEVRWKTVKELGREWLRDPKNWAVLVWGMAVFVSGAVLFMVMVGMLNNALPDKADRDLWFEASNQTINALFTLFVLLLHPTRTLHLMWLLRWHRKDIQNLRKVYSKRGTSKPNEWSHMLVVLLLYQLNCFAQYAVCALNWYYNRVQRPIIAVLVCFVTALSAGCAAGIYTSMSPLGKDSPLGDDDAVELATDKADKALPPRYRHRLLDRNSSLGPMAGNVVENPQWQGGLIECCEAPTLVVATMFCFPCVLGHSLGRLGFGNRYVHFATFLLAVLAPFVIFEMASVNVDSREFRHFLRAAGVVVSVCGLFYGGYWRMRMRETYGLPAETWCCGQPTLSDLAQWLMCSCCSLCQEVRTAEAFHIVNNRFYVKAESSVISSEPDREEDLSASSSSLQPLPVSSVVRIAEIALSNVGDSMLNSSPKRGLSV
ncbi:uncharacterized protein [Physcomitrium patens]|uniref:PLAC8 family protein n=1 Tax=Physcomitrium patens TaxID=3218 RepID=A0A2K1JFW5_PHYPA|nr:uncharacterized protein LOC112291031 [Physcomitrium patens]PNR40423.1 hypothetical protein PHYPA_017825 [Physcomitrium patens]|eukprot:XP_024393733.1 uncharacterized protein LOC112291031 [Physcomitrella patens]